MSLAADLLSLLQDATEGLPHVTGKKMFGCEALFVSDKIFALIWKEGRIALKVPASAASLLAKPGARPWSIGAKTMNAWVLVPEGFHDDGDALAEWAVRAHAEVRASSQARVSAKSPAAGAADRPRIRPKTSGASTPSRPATKAPRQRTPR